ncbi:MAG TPA: PAS domain S-box protein [Phycisphaerae bacterium]|nr:PAS domain S-box protein [Phycisphaerae bacterium]HNU43851.1 PAS domain S-box protein [Phycisphaerae bacterium]
MSTRKRIERTRAGQALREDERLRWTLLETISAATLIVQGSRVVYVNSAFERITGYTRADLDAMPFWDLVHPDHRALVKERGLARQRGAELPPHYEMKLLRKDGQTRWVDYTAALIELEGAPAVLGTAHDITQRKQAEDELRKFETMCAHANFGLVMCTPDGYLRYVNDTMAHMHGDERTAFVGKHLRVFHTEEQMPRVHLLLDKLRRKGGFASEEVWHVRRDGSVFPTLMNVAVINDAQGEPSLWAASALDITEQVRVQRALQGSEARLRTVVAASKDAMVAIDREGRITIFNSAAEQMFGRRQDEMLGGPLDPLMPESFRGGHREHVRHYFDTGQGVRGMGRTVELPALRADRTVFPIELSLSAGTSGDEVIVLAVIRDITRRKEAEQELLQAKEAAEAASRAKTDFLARISHEIRTPIMAMLGAAELARPPDSAPASAAWVDMVLRNGRHLLALLDDLLHAAQREVGQLPIRRTECDVAELLEDVRAVVMPLERRAEVRFEWVQDGELPRAIHTDGTRLKQAIINLITNALKFTEAGYVRVRVRAVTEGAARLVVAVEDTGPGIAPEHLEHIFEPFAQVHPAPFDPRGGVGLGLAVARSIARQLGGTLEVASVLGKGSTFTLTIPFDLAVDQPAFLPPDAQAALAGLPAPPPAEPGPAVPGYAESAPASSSAAAPRLRLCGCILLAEDFADTRELMRQALMAAGAEVIVVADGDEALAAAGSRAFDLILLDIRMPKRDGLETARELRRRGCLAPLIALTASVAEDQRRTMFDAGFDDLWNKPVSLEFLIESVAQYLEVSEAARPEVPAGVAPGSVAPASAANERDARSSAQGGATLDLRNPRFAAAVADFVRTLPVRLATLNESLDAGRIEQLRDVLHQLVGAAGVHGFMPLAHEAARLLAMLKKQDVGSLEPRLLGELQRLVAEAVETTGEVRV